MLVYTLYFKPSYPCFHREVRRRFYFTLICMWISVKPNISFGDRVIYNKWAWWMNNLKTKQPSLIIHSHLGIWYMGYIFRIFFIYYGNYNDFNHMPSDLFWTLRIMKKKKDAFWEASRESAWKNMVGNLNLLDKFV